MDTIIGQDKAVQVLQAALDSGRMHHAWIFHGPKGVGKMTTAMRVARILLCPDAQKNLAGHLEASHSSKSTHLIDSPDTVHPDLHIIRKEMATFSSDSSVRNSKQTNIPVKIIREFMLTPAYTTAQLGHNKVFIIDEAELLASEGQNTMLKTLEEPPEGTYLFLICNNEEQLLPTIRSRCQRVAFNTLDDAEVEAWIKSNMQMIPDEQGMSFLVQFAQGSLGDAQLAIDFGLINWPRVVNPLLDRIAAGQYTSDMGQQLFALCKEFSESWVKQHKNASKKAANISAVTHLLSLMGHLCNTRMQATIAANADSVDKAELEIQLAPWLIGIQCMDQTQAYLHNNVNEESLLEHLASNWVRRLTYLQFD